MTNRAISETDAPLTISKKTQRVLASYENGP
jgi:hypothetical protein